LKTHPSGCGLQEKFSNQKQTGTFAGYESQGRFFRLNTADGTLFEYKEGKLVQVQTSRIKLVVGEIYDDENGKHAIYGGALRLSAVNEIDALLRKYGVKKDSN
jgi:hypothetical protein